MKRAAAIFDELVVAVYDHNMPTKSLLFSIDVRVEMIETALGELDNIRVEPFTGLTVTTVEIALVGYTLLILFRNNLEGLRGVPPDVLEAARGMGYTRGQTLWKVELPLAVPAMMAGLRVAVVSTIALATVAALVIPEGLGYPIFLALREAFKTEILAAGALAIGLALVADGLLVLLQRVLTPWARVRRTA